MFAIVLAGVLSNTASEIGYVLLVPLAAIIFLAVGRHPLAGLAAAFAGVSGGYSANLLLGTLDPLLAGLTDIVSRESLERAVRARVPPGTEEMNLEALAAGYAAAEEQDREH